MENKRILSTVVLIIFLALLCVACWFAISLGVALTGALDNPTTGDGEMDMVAVGIVGMAIGAGIIFVFSVSILTILISLICLGFSIRNTKVEVKSVRVINIILSCCFAVAAAAGVTALILMRVL